MQCDQCEAWYHLLCVGLGREEVSGDEDYKCFKCKNRDNPEAFLPSLTSHCLSSTTDSSTPGTHTEIKTEPDDLSCHESVSLSTCAPNISSPTPSPHPSVSQTNSSDNPSSTRISNSDNLQTLKASSSSILDEVIDSVIRGESSDVTDNREVDSAVTGESSNITDNTVVDSDDVVMETSTVDDTSSDQKVDEDVDQDIDEDDGEDSEEENAEVETDEQLEEQT